jgi:Domain of unknown function (DUF6471)
MAGEGYFDALREASGLITGQHVTDYAVAAKKLDADRRVLGRIKRKVTLRQLEQRCLARRVVLGSEAWWGWRSNSLIFRSMTRGTSHRTLKAAAISGGAPERRHIYRRSHARRSLKAELKRADVSYKKLADRLTKHGSQETGVAIAIKLACGTFSATFLRAWLAMLELGG